MFLSFSYQEKRIEWTKITDTQWEKFYWSGMYRKVIIKSEKEKIVLTDLEFENFEALTEAIPNGKKLREDIDRWTVKSNRNENIVYSFLFFCIGIFFLYQGFRTNFFFIFNIVIAINMLLLYTCLKRIKKYSERIKELGF